MTTLVAGTLPASPGGTAVLTGGVTATPKTTVVTTNSLSANGAIVYSGISPVLSGVSQVLGAPKVPGIQEVTPLFEYLSIGFPRQILIR